MAVAFRAANGTDGGGGSTSIVLNKPTGTVDGDVMLAMLYIEDASGDPPTGLTAPSGWTKLQSAIANSSFWMAVYYKIAASEGSSYTWSWTPAAYTSGHIGSWSGCHATTPVDASAMGTATTGSTVTYPSVTTSVTDTHIVGLVSAWSVGETAPAGFSTADDPGTYTGAIYYIAWASSGAYGTYTGGVGAGPEGAIAATVALRPPAVATAKAPPPFHRRFRASNRRRSF